MTVDAALTDHASPAAARFLFLLGEHITASLSHSVWNSVFDAAGLALRYANVSVRDAELDASFGRLRAPDVIAANVTAPHKRAAAQLVDIADPEVSRCGACNFVVNRNGVLHGYNTDLTAVRRAFAGRRFGTAVLLGAGGAGAAALAGMRSAADGVLVLDRDPSAADQLAARAAGWGPDTSSAAWSRLPEAVRSADVIVNATPIGSNAADESPIAEEWLARRPAVYDFVYGGTPVIQRLARATGCQLHDGLAHLSDQAVGMLGELHLDPSLAPAIRAAVTRAAGHAPHRWDAGTGQGEPA